MRLISSITQKADEKVIVKLYHNVIQYHTAKVSTYYKTGIYIRHQSGQRKEARTDGVCMVSNLDKLATVSRRNCIKEVSQSEVEATMLMLED